MPRPSMRTILLAALVALILLALLGWRAGCQAADRAKAERNVAVATGDALDKVAAETPAIREEQAEKQRDVDEIQGADAPLPDGFGRDLERVRRGGGD